MYIRGFCLIKSNGNPILPKSLASPSLPSRLDLFKLVQRKPQFLCRGPEPQYPPALRASRHRQILQQIAALASIGRL
jgi:hypothetical protein